MYLRSVQAGSIDEQVAGDRQHDRAGVRRVKVDQQEVVRVGGTRVDLVPEVAVLP